jgi:hypothetical protein
LFVRHSISGAVFGPVCHRPASSAVSKNWFQLLVKSCDAEVAPPTKTGVNPFDEDKLGQYRCSCGDLIGLARLSEISIGYSSYNGADMVASRQFVGGVADSSGQNVFYWYHQSFGNCLKTKSQPAVISRLLISFDGKQA